MAPQLQPHAIPYLDTDCTRKFRRFAQFQILSLFVALIVSLLLIILASVCSAQEANDVLSRLKANDAQFDNVRVALTVTSMPARFKHERSDSTESEIELDDLDIPGAPVPERPSKWDEILIIRWPNLGGWREPAHGSTTSFGNPDHFRWRSVGQDKREMYAARFSQNSDEKEWIIGLEHETAPINNFQEHVIELKLLLGIGYGDRLKELRNITRDDANHIVIDGMLQMWWEDRSECHLLLDNDFLVREATIRCNIAGNLTHYHISNAGLFSTGDGRFRCARDGELVRVNGAMEPLQHVIRDLQVALTDVKFDISDEEYNDFLDFSPPANAKSFTIDHDAPRRKARPLHSPRIVGDSRFQVILINIFVIVIILAIMRVRKRLVTKERFHQ